MKAVICTDYGAPEVLQFIEAPKPVPQKNEVLIKIYATSVHIGDTRIRRADVNAKVKCATKKSQY